jgi:hypothetical protein
MPNFHNKDYIIGREEELNVLPILKDFFQDTDLLHSHDRYASFDFYSPTKKIEFKRRYCKMNKYPDLMIGESKISKARLDTSGTEYYFVFKFDDGIFYWKFDPNIYLMRRVGGRCDRGVSEIRPYNYIPTYLLKPI